MDIDGLKPEVQARLSIDEKLKLAGWRVQTWPQVNLGESLGVAVREYPTDSGPADYLLFVNRLAVGVIEAKKDETIFSQVEEQTLRYATSKIKFRKEETPLSFLFEATSQVIHFTDLQTQLQDRENSSISLNLKHCKLGLSKSTHYAIV